MFVANSGLVLVTTFFIIDTVRAQITEETLPAFTEENRPCGGVLNEAKGYLQTPGFPDKFQVPIKCKWIIDASLQPFNSTIVVYLTQLFVTTGLKFTESLFYDPELSYSLGQKFGENLLHSVTEKNCRSTSWLKTDAKFLIVDFELDQLEGNHLRSLDGLLDVYGFNITYEARSDSSDPVREPRCSVVDCSYEGHCYAGDNFTEFYCDCFPGFEGNDCSHGPLCSPEHNMCMNNSTCRHLGATTSYCSCPPGYKGSRCDVVSSTKQILPDCKISNTESCTPQCTYKLNQAPCSCPQGFSKAPTDRMRYQNTIKLGAPSGSRSELQKIHPNRTFTAQLERQVFKYLRNKIPKIDGLRVINLTLEGELTFHFFANKRDGRKVKDALNELVEKRHLGNITFAPSKISLRQNPTLLIKEVRVNQKKPTVRCGDDFILSCTAVGSPHLSFRWFKDGMVVNETIALRNIWTKQVKTDVSDQYMSLLGVKYADALDEGRYTCQVTDWGIEQCKTIDLEVIPPPAVKVIPMTVTVEKGSSLNIVCMWPVSADDRGQIYGYSWLKETKDSKEVNLFKMQKNVEEWEDLYPAGSILKVFSIQKSTKYTCQVQSNVGSVNASIDVEILNKTAVPWCEADNSNAYKMHWTETRVWEIAKVECPPHYKGIAKRMCSLIYTGQARWQTPDFSECISNRLVKISNQFQSLMLGFQNTTTVEILADVLELLKTRAEFYPGEGEPVLSLMQNITWYLNFTSSWNDLVEATPLFYSIINTLLQFDNAIINSQKVVDLQKMVNQWTIFWTSHIEPEFNPTLIFESLIVDVFSFDSSSVQSGIIFYLPRNNHMSYPPWFKESLAVIIDSGNRMPDNGTVCVAVVVYRDIMKYLPVRQIFKKEDGSEVEYEVASNVISFVSNAVLKTVVEIEFATLTRRGWNMTCGVMMTPWTRWQLEKCYVNTMSGRNVTQCSCKMLATFTALIMKTTVKNETRTHPIQTNIVLIGCLSCMVQSVLTLALLFVRLYCSPSYLIFLKIQCCTAVSAAMIVFLSATSTNLNESSYPFAAISLEAFLLLAMSSHLSKLLLVYAEVVNLTKIKSIKLTVISIMNGFTMLIMLCNYLVHNSSDWEMESWWLIKGTFIFYSCLTSGFLMAALFIFLYVCVMRHLALLLTIKSVQADSSKAIQRRLGLLRRAGLIFVSIYVMVAASIFYVNYPAHMSAQYAFSFTCVLLGFVLLTCYIIQSETSYHLYLIKKVGTDLAYMTGSDGNILSFFTKQDGEVESEAAPPSKDSYSCEDEGLQLKDMCSSNTASSKTDISHKSGKMVTFYSDLVSDCAKDDRQCNWESCTKNSQKFECSSSKKAECSEEPMMADKWHFMRANYCQNMPECQKSSQPCPEMVTTRVCVELGVIKNGDRGDNMMETPTIVLCSVDVEPCPGNVVELNEIVVKTIADTTHQSPDLLNHEAVKYTTSVQSCSTNPLPDNIPTPDSKNAVELSKSSQLSNVDNQGLSAMDDSDVLDRITQDLDYLLNRNSENSDDITENNPPLTRLPLTYIPEEDNELESTSDKKVAAES